MILKIIVVFLEAFFDKKAIPKYSLPLADIILKNKLYNDGIDFILAYLRKSDDNTINW